MKTTVKNIEELKNENAYTLFNRGGAYFNEKFLDHVVLEHMHKTSINGVEFIAVRASQENGFTFKVQTPNGGKRQNTTQVRFTA
jgi:hypothetical protein